MIVAIPKIIAEVLARDPYTFKTPLEINSGDCNFFAQEVARDLKRLYGMNVQTIWGCDIDPELDRLGCHMCLFAEGRYYDCEAPLGVLHPRDLPFYKRKAEFDRMISLVHEGEYHAELV